MAGRYRVGIIALQHESNTFLDRTTSLRDFQADVLAREDRVIEVFRATHHEVGGFLEGLAAESLEAVPLLAAQALPGGIIETTTAQRLLEEVERAAKQARGLDGLLVAPHGAAVSQIDPDFDGAWLSRLREIVGADMPIIATLDLHANVSARMVRSCQAMIAYHTNPHLDQRARGIEAARRLAESLRSGQPLTQVAALLPMAVGLAKQNTNEEPCRSLFSAAAAAERDTILSVSPLLGFPYADVPEMGSSLIVVANDDRKAAQATCEELARAWWERRAEFDSQGLSPEEAVERATTLPGPVGLLDMGDNVGGGSPGDGTIIARVILERGGPRSVVCLCDSEAVKEVASMQIGARVENWMVGGKCDRRHGEPLSVSGTLIAKTEGTFQETAVRHGGKSDYDMGPTVVVESDRGLTLVVHSHRTPPFSAGQITSTGLDPRQFHIIILKGVQAPVAAYASICRSFLRVNTPGVTTTDLHRLEYRHRRHPLYPLEDSASWHDVVFVEGA